MNQIDAPGSATLIDRNLYLTAPIKSQLLDVCAINHGRSAGEDILLAEASRLLKTNKEHCRLRSRSSSAPSVLTALTTPQSVRKEDDAISTYESSPAYRLFMEHLNDCIDECKGIVHFTSEKLFASNFPDVDPASYGLLLNGVVEGGDAACIASISLLATDKASRSGNMLYDFYQRDEDGELELIGRAAEMCQAQLLLECDARYLFWAKTLAEVYGIASANVPRNI